MEEEEDENVDTQPSTVFEQPVELSPLLNPK